MPTASAPGFDPASLDHQRAWSDWRGVDDRDELVRRARLLSRSEELDPALGPFLLFIFRASDPQLYQAAALALGRHMGEHEGLGAAFARYRDEAGVPATGPVPLGGRRTHRRILLARAADRGPEGGLAALPGVDGTLAPRDLGALLVAVDHLVEGANDRAVARSAARRGLAAADRFLADGGGAGVDRVLVGHLARILAGAARVGHGEEARRLWLRLVRRVSAAHGPGPAERGGGAGALAAHLRRLDELARCAARAGGRAGGSGWAPPPELDPETRRWLAARIREWTDAEGGFPGGDPARSRERLALVRAFRRLEDRRDWLAPDPRDRGRLAFRLLDPVQRLRFQPGELAEIVGQEPADLPLDPLTGPMLGHFLAHEPDGEKVLDAALVHRLGNPELFRLLEGGGPDSLRPALADAVEHRFRLALSTAAGFDAEGFLAALEAVRPGDRFRRELLELARGRRYETPGGEAFPLVDALVEALEGDPDPDPPPPAHRDPRRGALREGLHEARTGEAGEAELPVRVRTLGRILSGPLPRFLRRVERARGGEFAGSAHEAVRGTARALEGLAPLPGTSPEPSAPAVRASALREALLRSADALDLLSGTEVARALPPAEARLLERAAEELRPRLLHEARALARASASGPGGVEGELGALAELADPGLRRLLVVDRARRLVREEGLDGSPESAARLATPAGWASAVAGLRGAARLSPGLLPIPADREAWSEALARGWAALVRHGLDRGHPRRLAGLVRDDALRHLATRAENRHVLHELRSWFLDVHRPVDAAVVTRLLAHAGPSAAGLALALPVTLGVFVARHAALWLALLVGAILMLDFGDAWKAMAEVGDVRGIGITAAVGLAGAFSYLLFDLRRRIRAAPEDPWGRALVGDLGRAVVFLGATALYTVALTAGLWFLLSGTDEVVHGAGAPLHVAAWSAFALFAGVFFGLLAKEG
jgi:hypothetical protein